VDAYGSVAVVPRGEHMNEVWEVIGTLRKNCF